MILGVLHVVGSILRTVKASFDRRSQPKVARQLQRDVRSCVTVVSGCLQVHPAGTPEHIMLTELRSILEQIGDAITEEHVQPRLTPREPAKIFSGKPGRPSFDISESWLRLWRSFATTRSKWLGFAACIGTQSIPDARSIK